MSKKRKPIKRKEWSPDHIKTLKSLAGKVSAAKIGRATGGRSVGAVRQKAMTEEISLKVKEKYKKAA